MSRCRTWMACGRLLAVVLGFSLACPAQASEAAMLYVSPAGDDTWSGRYPAVRSDLPATVRADGRAAPAGPLATLAEAVARIPSLLRDEPTSRQVAIVLRGGVYHLDQTVVLNRQLLAGDMALTIKAYPGERVLLSGGVPVLSWSRVQTLPPGMPALCRDHVWVADIPAGVENFHVMYDGFEVLPRARSAGIDLEETPPYISDEMDRFCFPAGALRNGSNLEDVEVVARTVADFVVNILPLAAVDEVNRVAWTRIPATYAIGKLVGYPDETPDLWVENVPEALDEPGEWIVNTRQRKVYYWPRNGTPGPRILVPRLIEFIRVEGDIDAAGTDVPIRDVSVEGLVFAHSDRATWNERDRGIQHDWEMIDKANAFVRLRGAERCTVKDCHFLAGGSTGIRLDRYARHNVIVGNRLENLGGSGIVIAGYGPGWKDVSGGNEVLNNHISRCGWAYWHYYGIMIWQSGRNRIAHNLVHDLPYGAIGVTGVRPNFLNRETMADRRENGRSVRWDEVCTDLSWEATFPYLHTCDNVVENNEIHHVLLKLGDGNGIYLSGTGPGNLVQRNYLHDIAAGNRCRGAIRTDGWQRDTVIRENIIYRCVRGIVRKNYNHVENNVIVDCVDMAEYMGFWSFPQDRPTAGARVQRNILYHVAGPGEFYNRKPRAGVPYTAPADCYADFNVFYSGTDALDAEAAVAALRDQGIERHSVVADPLFVEVRAADFRLRADSPARRLGIKSLDRRAMGLEPVYRQRSWPVPPLD